MAVKKASYDIVMLLVANGASAVAGNISGCIPFAHAGCDAAREKMSCGISCCMYTMCRKGAVAVQLAPG